MATSFSPLVISGQFRNTCYHLEWQGAMVCSISLVPRPPHYCYSVCVQYHTQKQQNSKRLFHFCILYWTQTKDQKRGRPGNKANAVCMTGTMNWLVLQEHKNWLTVPHNVLRSPIASWRHYRRASRHCEHANCSVMFTLSTSWCHFYYMVSYPAHLIWRWGAGINQCSQCEHPVSHLHQGLLLQLKLQWW